MIIDLTTTTFPIPTDESWNILDSSKLNTYLDCPRRFFYEYLLGWRQDYPNNHLIFGEAWHDAMEFLLVAGVKPENLKPAFETFLATYRKRLGPETDEQYFPKDPSNAATALTEYITLYQGEPFTVLHTEVGVRVPLNEEDCIVGRIDAIVSVTQGKIWFFDHKTGSRLDRTWESQWDMSLQMGTYLHALHCCFNPNDIGGGIINGVFFQKGENKFRRKPVQKSLELLNAWLWNVNEWLKDLKTDMARLADAHPISSPVLGAFRQNTQSCTKYFGCPFAPFCSSWANPLAFVNEGPPPGFKVEFWNPEAREKPARVLLTLKGITTNERNTTV